MILSDLPSWYFITVAAIFGALVGSFLNVVIARVPLGLSVIRPASRCPGCERPIRWYENVPIFSWLALRGRCRGCEMAISIRYPLVELATALLAVACVRQFEPTLWAVAAFAFLAALVALTYIDLDYWLLPHGITIPFIALGLLASFIPDRPDPVGIASSALGAAVGFGSFWLIGAVAERILKKEALGGGDLWLFAMIGAWLGLRALLPVALLASAQGALIGAILLSVAKRRARDASAERDASTAARTSPGAGASTETDAPTETGASTGAGASKERAPLSAIAPPKPTGDEELDEWVPPEGAIPFGPFLALGAAEYLFFGERLVQWYLALIQG